MTELVYRINTSPTQRTFRLNGASHPFRHEDLVKKSRNLAFSVTAVTENGQTCCHQPDGPRAEDEPATDTSFGLTFCPLWVFVVFAFGIAFGALAATSAMLMATSPAPAVVEASAARTAEAVAAIKKNNAGFKIEDRIQEEQ